jgi:hypothetical protein
MHKVGGEGAAEALDQQAPGRGFGFRELTGNAAT